MSGTTDSQDVAGLRRARLGRNHWYPLALSNELGAGQALGVQFSADPIVVVRTHTGTLFALEDRCVHRQVPLSKGRVDGEYLKCAYHGWRYNAAGRCSPPSEPRFAIGVRSYPVFERNGLIHVFLGDGARASQISPPDIAEARSGAYLCIPFRRELGCHYSFVHENLMDMSHQILHRRWTGRFNPRMLAMRSSDDHVAVDYAADFREGSALLRFLPAAILRFQSRNKAGSGKQIDVVTVSTDYPYQSLVYHRSGLDEPLLKLWNAYIPVGAREAITRPLGLLLVRKPHIPVLLWMLKPLLLHIAQRIFDEDRAMMELEQLAYETQGEDCNQERSPFLLELRRLLLARAEGAKSNAIA